MTLTRVYAAEICKSERDPKGNLIVYGKATSPALDHDEQICDPTWLAAAMPAWFTKGGANVREQHSNIAAGVGIDLERSDGDGWMLRSKIVDPVSARKVEEGVLKGYSIGIRNAQVIKDKDAPGGRICGGVVVEVSLVDAPCNPEAMLCLAKSVGGELAEVEELTEGADDVHLELAKSVAAEYGAIAEPEPDPAEDVTKADEPDDGAIDESEDINGAQQAIGMVCDLIISEATALKTGRLEEIYDLSLLQDALCTLQRFICREQQQDTTDADQDDDEDVLMAYVGLADEPDLTKAKYTAEQKRAMVAAGHAILNPDGKPSYPIGDRTDLKRAIRAVGRGNADHNAVRRHIVRSAKRLGASEMIPDDWNRDGSLKPSPAKAIEPEPVVKSATVAPAEPPVAQNADDTIEKHVAVAMAEHSKVLAQAQERTKALEAEIARLSSMPVPGGPMLMRPHQSIPSAQATADRFRALAQAATDPSVRAAYRALATQDDGE